MSVRFALRLTPRAGRDAVDGVDVEGRLRVRVAAPPVDGAANESLIRLLARELGLAPSAVRLESGAGSRQKLVSVELPQPTVETRWPGLKTTLDPG